MTQEIADSRCKLNPGGFGHSGARHGEGCAGCDEQHRYLFDKHVGPLVRPPNALDRLTEALRDAEDALFANYSVTADVEMASGSHLRWGKIGSEWLLTYVDAEGAHPLLRASAARRIEASHFLDGLRTKLDASSAQRDAEVLQAIERTNAFVAALRERTADTSTASHQMTKPVEGNEK